MRKNQVFISYARSDRGWAEWLGSGLAKHGFEISTDTTSVPTGESFIAELKKKTIEKSAVLLAILSPSYFNSAWCQQETAVAAASKVPIIPILVEPYEVQGFLRNYNWADLTSDRDNGLREVILAAECLPAQSPGMSDLPGTLRRDIGLAVIQQQLDKLTLPVAPGGISRTPPGMWPGWQARTPNASLSCRLAFRISKIFTANSSPPAPPSAPL
jgi:hypothetical protein